MTLIAVEGLTLGEFADLLCDVLTASGYTIDRARTIQLQIGVRVIDWRFPAVIVASKSNDTSLFVPRFGETANVPGYLAKYLDGARRNMAAAKLYLACHPERLQEYGDICELYGLGLVGCSLETHRAQFAREPTPVDITTAFETQLAPIIAAAETAFRDWLDRIDKGQRGFLATAKRMKRPDHAAEFDAERERAHRWIVEIRERAAELRGTKSLDDLRELRRAVDEVP